MRRRKLLAAFGATAIAGCFGADGEDEPAEEPDGQEETDDGEDGTDDEQGSVDDEDGGDTGEQRDADEENSNDEENSGDEENSDEEDGLPGARDHDPVVLSGSGDETTETFDVSQGLTIMRIDPYETVDVAVYEAGADVGNGTDQGRWRSLESETRLWRGVVPLLIPAGEYVLDVRSNGDWSISIEEPVIRTQSIMTPPVSFSNDEPEYYGPIEFDGDTTMTFEHAGRGECMVKVLALDGETAEEPIEGRSGIFETEIDIEYDREGWLLVKTEGDYDVQIE